MRKFLILPGCDDTNRGDQALIWETVSLAKEAGYEGQFFMLADAEKAQQSKYRGIEHIDYILPHPSTHFQRTSNLKYTLSLKLKWACAAVFDLISREFLVHSWIRKIILPLYSLKVKQSMETFSQAETAFVKGGGFLHAYGGFADIYKIYYFLYHIRLALSFGQAVYVMPNSFGPFDSPMVKGMVRRVLSRCNATMARESYSQRVLDEKCGIKSLLYPDLAFFLERNQNFDAPKCLREANIPIGERPCVAITMRPYRFSVSSNPEEKYRNYQKVLADLSIELAQKGYYPVLVEHVFCELEHERDMSCILDVATLLKNQCAFGIFSDLTLTCEEMKSIYSCFDYTIGTRFHSVIFSLSEGIPSIAITYGGNKGIGIMTDIGLSEYAIPIDSISTPELLKKFELLEKNVCKVKEKLSAHQAGLPSKKEQIISLIRKDAH